MAALYAACHWQISTLANGHIIKNTMKQQFFPQRLFMDMKRLIINRLVGLGLLAVGVLASCSAPTAFVPVPSPNPWADDYTALSSMENYKQWGTYNVHDPACKK